jgi:hypothetical protein
MMSRALRLSIFAALTAFVAMPALAATPKPKSPGEMAAMDRAANLNRATCEREAKAQKLSYFKRRRFVKNCVMR